MPVEEMPRFYKMADAMIVSLSDNKTISYTLPGKIQSYMAAGKACLGSASGETKKTIEEAQCGLCAKPEDPKDFARIAKIMADSDFVQYGKNARKYYDEHYLKSSHVDRIEKMLKGVKNG